MDKESLNIYEILRDEIINQIGEWEENDFQNSKITKKEFINPNKDTILKLIIYRNNKLDMIPYCKKMVKEKIDN